MLHYGLNNSTQGLIEISHIYISTNNYRIVRTIGDMAKYEPASQSSMT